MKKTIKVAKGKDLLDVRVSSHSFVVLCDQSGSECFRSESKGGQITIAVTPGSYTLETDGKFSKVAQSKLDSDLRPKKFDGTKPPKPRRKNSKN